MRYREAQDMPAAANREAPAQHSKPNELRS